MNNVTRNNFLFVEKTSDAVLRLAKEALRHLFFEVTVNSDLPLSYPSLRNIDTMGEMVSMKVTPMAMTK